MTWRWERAFPRVDAGLFSEPTPLTWSWNARPRGGKVTCLVCDRKGYMGGAWMEGCRRGHAPCPLCGRMLTVLLDGSPRMHARCPQRRATQWPEPVQRRHLGGTP